MRKNFNPVMLAAAMGGVTAQAQNNGFSAIGARTCVGLQARLFDYFGANVAQFRNLGQTSLIKWLLSPQNTANFQRINVESVPGKKRAVVFRLQDPYCFTLCRNSLDCTETPVFVDHTSKEVVFDLTSEPFRHCVGGIPAVLRFSEEDLMKFCTETDASIIQDDMARYILQYEKALDQALGTVYASLVGRNGKNEAVTNIPFWVTNNQMPGVSAINPSLVWYLQQLYTDLGMDGQYGMLGGITLNKLMQFNKWTANNVAGVDLSQTDNLNPYTYYNRNLESVIGQDDVIMQAPGVVQLVTWNKYVGEKARRVNELYTHGTLILPTTGIQVDYKWTYDYQCEVWIFEVFLHCELASVPAGGCGANLANVNGMIRIHDCSGVSAIPTCPTPAP